MSKTRVLIVDDEIEFASALAERLQLRGYDARAVYCAEDALAAARTDPPHVVLLDLKIPGMSGIEISKNIRQTNPVIRIILLTGENEGRILREGINQDIYDYLLKPVDIGELTKKIDSASDRAKEDTHGER